MDKSLCINTNAEYGISGEEQIRLFRKIGFDGFFTHYNFGVDLASYRKTAEQEKMLFPFVHVQPLHVAALWEGGGQDTFELYIKCLHECADNGIPIMVAHVFGGFDKHAPTPAGITQFEKIVQEAQRYGVKIAMENLEGEEYLAALMAHFEGCDAVGFCWDTGHEMCYAAKDMMALYGDRILCTHLNDNLGIRRADGVITGDDDLHLLPFDGIGDWENIIGRLEKHNYNGPLTFELKINSKKISKFNQAYSQMTAEEYLKEAYKRACKVAALVK